MEEAEMMRWMMMMIILTTVGTNLTVALLMGGGLFFLVRRINAVQSELRAEMDKRFGEVNRQFGEVNRQFGEVNRRFDEVNRRFDEINSKLMELFTRVGVLEGTVRGIETNITHLMGFVFHGRRPETPAGEDDARTSRRGTSEDARPTSDRPERDPGTSWSPRPPGGPPVA